MSLNNNDTIKSLSDRDVTELLEDQYGNIWIGTRFGGLNKFMRETETFKHYWHHPGDSSSLSHNGAYTLYEDKKGTLWIGTINGLNKFQPQTETFKSYYNDPGNLNTLSNNEIYAMLEDRRGNFWVGTRNGLNLFNTCNTGRSYNPPLRETARLLFCILPAQKFPWLCQNQKS